MSYKTFKPDHLELINHKGREPVQPPRLLDTIKKNTLSSCEQLLAHLFSATDDLFYDLSKRASSNNEQNLYFEAMREIRVKREGIANQFLREISTSFTTLINTVSHESILNDENDVSSLSIVEGDDLEVDLARSNMISRTRDMFFNELNELGLRLDHLLLQVEVSEDNNPLDPQQLSDAFITACQSKLEIDIKAKLILYKLYEKHILKQLGHIYADANQALLDAGILPKIPKSMESKKPVHGGAAPEQEAPATEQEQTQHHQYTEEQLRAQEFRMGVDALSLLMATARNMAFGTNAGQHVPITQNYQLPAGLSYYSFSTNPGPVMASPQLAALLTQSQYLYDQQLTSQPRTNIVANAVQHILAESNPQAPQALEQDDENIINLVSLFFEQILNDETLPPAIQGLLFRLQIPILKVALKDQTFFSNPQHPARELINAITDAGIGFDESKPIEKDPLYKKIAEIIQCINRQYKTDDAIFTEQKGELEAMIEREKRKAEMVEQRTTQSEAGKSKIKQARIAAQNLMYQRLKDAALPESVHDFLTRHWLQVLVFCHLKHGPDSNEWVTNEQAITDLIWISAPHDDVRSTQRRERLFPELLDRIEFGLELAINDTNTRKTTVQELEATLTAIHAKPEPEEDFQTLTEEHKAALGKGENDPKSWDEMTAVERQQSHYEELSSQYFENAKNMSLNTWFEYYDTDNAKTVRCKLASKIDSETYIFVNRLGFKVLERTRKQFACDMQFKRAKNLEVTPVFDRIMGRVVKNISPEEETL